MVTMTSEMDKTQTSIAMAAKCAAENVTETSANSAQLAEGARVESSAVDVDGGGGGAGVVPTITTLAPPQPIKLSSVTISIDLASDDDDDDDDDGQMGDDGPAIAAAPACDNGDKASIAAAPASGVEATTTATPATATTITQAEAENVPTPATPSTAISTTTISATITTTPPCEIATTTTPTHSISVDVSTTATNTTITTENSPNSNASAKRTSSDQPPQPTAVTQIIAKSPIIQCVSATVMATAPLTDAAYAAITTTTTTTISVSSASASTARVNFNTSNSTGTSSNTNSGSSVTSMSSPPPASVSNGSGNGSGTNNASGAAAGMGVGMGMGSSQRYHHTHHQQQQQQQNNQHGKSSADSGGGGGGSGSGSGNGSGSGSADGSHTFLPSAKHSMNIPTLGNHLQQRRNEDAPNIMVYKKMEAIIEKMQAESTGVAVRTVKAFMSKVPSVFTGADLIAWILKNFDVEDVTEALHFAHSLASHGYIFPIDDHQLTVKNDGTFYRFQTPYFWPSNCWEPENTDYAVYLCKRTMQNKTRLELADYEAENLAKLQKMFSRKWEFIFMQAESQSKVAKKRDKLERKVLDSQERAFWDVHRPMPGCVNTTEIDIKKAYRRGGHGSGTSGGAMSKNPIEQVMRVIALRKQKLERRTIKVSKAAEALVAYYEQYNEFDYFITSPELPNPWQTDSTEMWDAERNSKEVPLRRVKRWGFSLRELLNDPVGRDQFSKFLEKEYSGENLKFWESVQQMKTLPQSEIKEAIQKIWQEFLAPDAPCPVNVDSKSVELAREAVNAVNGPNRWCFDVAAAHVYHLMKSDSYSRYLRSEMYKDYLNCSRKKVKSIPNLFGVKR